MRANLQRLFIIPSKKHGFFLAVLFFAIMSVTIFIVQPNTLKALACPCNVFATTPSPSNATDSGGVEVGMKFRSDSDGLVTGVKFYKTAPMTGLHTGNLWDSSGTNLATVTFSGETTSGWQEAVFSTPVSITAHTTYTISVFHANGIYAFTTNYFTSEVVNAPLRAPADGAAPDSLGNTGQGVFNSANTSAYPSSSFNKANYWVDVLFFDTSIPTVTGVDPIANATNVAHGKAISATFDQGMSASTFTNNTFSVQDSAHNAVAGNISYNAATKTATFMSTDGFASNQLYTATLKGGSGAVIKNQAGTPLATDYSWSFTIVSTNNCPCTLKDKSNPAGSTTFDDAGGNELGIKIRPTTNGYITAIRFYKPVISTETTHTGRIWDAAGNSLAAATFTNETEYGWQEARLTTPLRVTENQTYIISYGTTTAVYQATTNGLTSALTSGYLKAFADTASENAALGSGNRNGVFSTTAGNYPNQGSTNGSYFWIDAVFSVAASSTDPLEVKTTQPSAHAYGASHDQPIRATFDHPLNPATVTNTTMRLFDAHNNQISGTASYTASTASATFMPSSNLTYGQLYTAKLSASVADINGNTLGSEFSWSFTVGSALNTNYNQGPGGPIAILTTSANKYSSYYAEILRAEGFNYFVIKDISTVNSSELAQYDAVILAEMSLTQPQAAMFETWVSSGGNLVAMRPDKKLAELLGLQDSNSTRANQYLTVHTASGPGMGIVSESMQFKGLADNYTLNGASTVATLYSDSITATPNPAVTYKSVGSQGGMAMAFTYDLAKSVIAQHQGNQAWVGQDRDGLPPVRSNDLFYGARSGDIQPDFVNVSKMHIPQADEQQRLLGNLLTEATKDRRPLPKFWYLPGDVKAAMVMAGDDHGLNNIVGTERVFNNFLNESPTYCAVDSWQCVRGSNYTYESAALTQARALQYYNLGFEIGAHVSNSALCNNYTSYAQLSGIFTSELATWRSKFTSLPNQITHRYHCYVWSDWDSMSRVEEANGMRYDLNYVAYPSAWVNNRAPVLTGSGMNMRLTDADGDLLDVYQGVTNLDDTAATVTAVNALLDNAIGSAGYYGIYGTHFDMTDTYHTTLLNAAKARSIPIISSAQAVAWWDGRNSSKFSNFAGSDGQYTFDITAAIGAQRLKAMMPINDAKGTLTNIQLSGASVGYQTQTIKGLQYALFNAEPGSYTVTYSDYIPPASGGGAGGNSSGEGSASSSSSSPASQSERGASVVNNTPLPGSTQSQDTPLVEDPKTSQTKTEQKNTMQASQDTNYGTRTDNTWLLWVFSLGGLLLGIIIWLFWRHRKHRTAS